MAERTVGPITLHREYRDAVATALLCLQYVEEGMRMYLDHCFTNIKVHLRHVFPYKRSRADIQKKSWGQLLGEIKQMCGNDALLAELTRLNCDRNFCAHQALLLKREELNDIEYRTGAMKKLDDIESRANKCALTLFAEMRMVSERATASMAKQPPTDAD